MSVMTAHPKLLTVAAGFAITLAISTILGILENGHHVFALQTDGVRIEGPGTIEQF